ncbi:hypothetical protein NQ318_012206 [Aromia moschata]|uniref:Nose resistant-to-fluoxetine protein N-terminal domain-containing protein n=1 Tax=Aromia moschata TaxID=1265417 RepID=A0AAV8YM63_9CUCU|nr:hypothetical protein NQ318_012206 [Aromia moschata]
MSVIFWCVSCFLMICAQTSWGLVLDHLVRVYRQNSSATVDPVQLFIPTVNAENEKCREHSRHYLEELRSFKLWATEMYDATAKFPSGVLYGSTYDLGNFDQCVEVKVPFGDDGFTGQYCLAKMTVKPPNYYGVGHNIDYERDDYKKYFNISAWEKMAAFAVDDSKASRNELYVSFCLPSSCTSQDLKQTLQKLIRDNFGFIKVEVSLDVEEASCQVHNAMPYTTGEITFICIVVGFAVLVIFVSVYDLLTKMEDLENYKMHRKLHKILICFSFRKNLKKLASESRNEDGLQCIAGLKVLSMFCIIMGHRCMFTLGYPVINPKFVEEIYRKVEATSILNGPIIVDTFFIISGFLATYLTITLFEKSRNSAALLLVYVHRIVRMLPAYGVVLAFYCTIFVRIGSGPFWQQRLGLEQQRCLQSWWANLLYINNYVNVDKICMFQSWYLTCDMHYFLLIPPIVWLLRRRPNVGLMTVVSLILASLFVVFAVVYVNNEDAILLLYMKLLKDPILNNTFRKIYIPSHMRATPYLVGIVIGYIKYKMKMTNYKMPKYLLYVGWVLCAFVSLGTVFTAFVFYLPQVPHDTVFSALYASMHHFTFSLSIGWIIIAVSSGNGPWIEPILSWKPLIFLSRITYTAFLSHGAIQMYTAATLRGPKYASVFNIAYDTFGDIVLAYMIGFVLSIYFEAPIMQLEKLIFGKREKETVGNHPKILEEMVISIPKIKSIPE